MVDDPAMGRLLGPNLTLGTGSRTLAYTAADWDLHHGLTVLSGNPVYTLILNGFSRLYATMGLRYFALSSARQASLTFYLALLEAARRHDPDLGEEITRQVMIQSIGFWNQVARK